MCKLKDNPIGDKVRIFKSKLVARGFTQKKGVNYNKVFHVANYVTICLVCALAAIVNLVMYHMDVIQLFSMGI